MTRRLEQHAAMFGFAVALALISACGKKEGTPATKGDDPAPTAKHKPRIALVMKSLANEFFLTMETGAREHQKAHAADYDLLPGGIKNEQDVAQQVSLVEQMIAQKVDALVIAPADSKALVPVCKKAIDAGIVVVNIDNKFDAEVLKEKSAAIPFAGPDNRKGAKLAGDYLGGKLAKGDKVAIVEGLPSAFNGIQRRLGFEDAMKSAGMTIASSQAGDWEMDKANQVASAMLLQTPELKALLCANDSMALGALAALRASGREGKIHIIGFDNISAVRDLVRGGKILATVDQHGDKLAVFGIEFALEMLAGKAKPADRETPVDLVTAETLK